MCRVLQCIPGKLETVLLRLPSSWWQSDFLRLKSTEITAISLFFFVFFPISLFQLELRCHKGNTWRKQVILGYQAVGKCLGKWAFPSVFREGEKLSHCSQIRTWQLRPSLLLLQGDVVLACVLLLWWNTPKSNPETKGFICLTLPGHNPSWKGIRAGTSAGTRAEAMEECCSLVHALAHTRLLFYSAQAYLPRDGTAHSGFGPPILISQGNLLQTWSQVSLI